jgi:hypothetical protein
MGREHNGGPLNLPQKRVVDSNTSYKRIVMAMILDRYIIDIRSRLYKSLILLYNLGEA